MPRPADVELAPLFFTASSALPVEDTLSDDADRTESDSDRFAFDRLEALQGAAEVKNVCDAVDLDKRITDEIPALSLSQRNELIDTALRLKLRPHELEEYVRRLIGLLGEDVPVKAGELERIAEQAVRLANRPRSRGELVNKALRLQFGNKLPAELLQKILALQETSNNLPVEDFIALAVEHVSALLAKAHSSHIIGQRKQDDCFAKLFKATFQAERENSELQRTKLEFYEFLEGRSDVVAKTLLEAHHFRATLAALSLSKNIPAEERVDFLGDVLLQLSGLDERDFRLLCASARNLKPLNELIESAVAATPAEQFILQLQHAAWERSGYTQLSLSVLSSVAAGQPN